jgi:RNA polymerase sigma-70 factor (ECF subfamily)
MSKNPRITSEEVTLIKRAQAGDMSAFNTLFHKYKTFVDNILFQYIKDMDEAKDLTNIVFLKVYNKLSTFKAYDSFGGWLRIIANRTAIDYLREVKNSHVSFGDSVGRLPSEEPKGSTEDDLVNRMTYEHLLSEFDKLPESSRKVLRLFYVNNMTVEQISNALRMPTGTIKSTLSRTRKRIQKHLKIKTT